MENESRNPQTHIRRLAVSDGEGLDIEASSQDAFTSSQEQEADLDYSRTTFNHSSSHDYSEDENNDEPEPTASDTQARPLSNNRVSSPTQE